MSVNPATLSVLLVEDDRRLAALTREYLEGHGAVVAQVADGAEALRLALRQPFDVVLLDLMLPGLDGLALCRQLRQHRNVPILMLTARGEVADRVLGLEAGADDYLAKPFSPRELLARIHAVLRRAQGRAGPERPILAVGPLQIDPSRRSAELDGQDLELTGYEFDLLYALARRAGRVLSREQLMMLARGSADEAFDRSVDVHISHLRRKLGDDPRSPRFIHTIRGVGYQLADTPSEPASS